MLVTVTSCVWALPHCHGIDRQTIWSLAWTDQLALSQLRFEPTSFVVWCLMGLVSVMIPIIVSWLGALILFADSSGWHRQWTCRVSDVAGRSGHDVPGESTEASAWDQLSSSEQDLTVSLMFCLCSQPVYCIREWQNIFLQSCSCYLLFFSLSLCLLYFLVFDCDLSWLSSWHINSGHCVCVRMR